MQYFDTGIMQPLLVGDLFVEHLSCLCMLFDVDVVAVAGAAHGKAFGPASPGWKLEPRSLGAVARHRDRGQMGGASALVTSLIQMVAKFVSLPCFEKVQRQNRESQQMLLQSWHWLMHLEGQVVTASAPVHTTAAEDKRKHTNI